MPLTKSNFPRTYNIDLDVIFSRGMDSAGNAEWRMLTETVPVRGNAKNEVFYGDKNRLRRFRSERQPQIFREYKLQMTLDNWEMTELISKDDLGDIPEEARAGSLRNTIGNFTNAVSSSLEAEFWEFLHNGTSITGFDQNNLFDFNHTYTDSSNQTVAGITQSNMNLGGSQVDTTTIQLLQQHFANELLTDTSKPWRGRLTHVAVKTGSDNAKNAAEIANSQFTVQGSAARGSNTVNVFQGAFDVITFDYGFGASEWLGLDLSRSEFKPVKVLSHVDNGIDNMEFSQQTNDSHEEFWRRDWAFGVFGRFDFNPGYYQTVYLHGSSGYTFTPSDSESQRVLYPNQ